MLSRFKSNSLSKGTRLLSSRVTRQIVVIKVGKPALRVKKKISPDVKEAEYVSPVPKEETSLKSFLSKVYTYTGAGIFAGLSTAAVVSTQATLVMPAFCIGLFGSILSIAQIHWIDKTKNPESKKPFYGMLCVSVGLVISPVVHQINEISSTILPQSAFLSLAVMGGAAFYALRSPPGSLLTWKAPLMGGLVGLCATGVLSLASHLIFGPTAFSYMLTTADTYGGIALFTALTAYDTQYAISKFEKGNRDYVSCAIDFYLSFINLFLRIAKILADSKRK